MRYTTLLLFFLLPVFCNAQLKIFYNARIFTSDVNHPFAEAVAISGKKIIAVGNYAEVKKAAGPSAEAVDCNGNFLMPGFIDSHIHAIEGGKALIKANAADKLLSIHQLAEYAGKVLQSKDEMTGDVLVISGINISTWSQLDEVISQFNAGEFSTRPVVLHGSDGHTSWANTIMMKRAGLNHAFIQSLQPADRIFYGITKEGEPNGFTNESGQSIIRAAIPADTGYCKAAEKTMEYCNSHGITALLDPSAGDTHSKQQVFLDAYAWLLKTGRLTAHIAATIVCDANSDPRKEIDAVKKMQQKYDGINLQILGCKIFADGVIEHPTHTAALSVAYTGTASKGVLMFEPKKFERFAIAADKEHLLIHVHAIGDRAVTETLNGFEAVRKTSGNYTLPHTITHLQIVQPADFERFAKLHVLAAYQMLWAFGDITTIDIVKPYIDPSLYKWQYPARSMLQAGAIICGASDWPVSTANPFDAIYNAETRRGPMGVLDSTQCMPRMAMLYAYTINAAKAMMNEKQTGSLQPGKFADIIMLDRDIITVTPEAMKATNVVWTMFEGKMVYKAGALK